MMSEKDVLKHLIKSEALYNTINVVTQKYDILPDNKEHVGAYIEYQDLMELRDDFLNELIDTIVDWVYSSKKYEKMKKTLEGNGKSSASAASEIQRKVKEKFRGNKESDNLMAQGQLGELLLFHFIQYCMKAVPLLRKMPITTSAEHERFGADAIHYKVCNDKNIIVLGEAKTYTSKYKFNQAFEDAVESILKTYRKHRQELNLYVHEDFLDEEMNIVAEAYLNNTMNSPEVHLVSIVIYNETSSINITSQEEIKKQIETIIAKRYSGYDKNKIDLEANPILKRITYIVFPIWKLEELVKKFQEMF